MSNHNKHKILNDPVYGFITIQHTLSFDLMDHPYVQRLRRISQLGLSHLVYPGAVHNRFHHAIGALHLMQEAIAVLRAKGTEISDSERKERVPPSCFTTLGTDRSATPSNTASSKASITRTSAPSSWPA